ncbi:MAG TPA: hypothetical protein VFE50_13900, partial [Cyclobacteriaceae bacterium]|nr:hypothetical protein [Cyclobacteriaceae bacterium]
DDHVNFGHLYMGISKLYSARGDFNEMDRCFNLGAQILSNRIGPGCRPIMEGLIEATTTSEKLYRAGEVPEAAYKALRRGMASLIQSDVDAVKILLGAYNPHFHRTIDAAADELLDSGDEAGAARLQAEAAELRRLTNLYSQIRYDHLPHKTLEGDEKEAAIVLLREKISLPEDPERVEIIKIDLSFFKTFRLYKITYKNTPLSADRFVLMNDREITPITRALRQVLEHIEADGVIDVNSAMDYFIFFYDCQAGFFIIRNADDVPWRLNADVTESDKANFAKWITHPKIISASDDLITIRALMVSGDAIFRCDFDIHPKPVTNSHGTFNAGMCFQRNDWLYTFKSDDSLLLSGYVIQDGVEVKVKTDIDGNPVELSDDEETFCGLNIAHMPVYQARKLRTTDDLISQLLPLSKQYADLVAIMIPGEEMEGLSMHISSRAAEFTTQLTREEKIDFDNLKDFVRTVLRVVVQYRALVIQSIPDENDWRIKTVDMHLNLYNYLLSELDKTTTSS